MKKTGRSKNVSKTTSCRLEAEHRQALEARADELNMNINDLVKEYVIAGLQEASAKDSVFDALIQVRRDLSLMAEALLLGAGKLDEKEAYDWAQKNIYAR